MVRNVRDYENSYNSINVILKFIFGRFMLALHELKDKKVLEISHIETYIIFKIIHQGAELFCPNICLTLFLANLGL